MKALEDPGNGAHHLPHLSLPPSLLPSLTPCLPTAWGAAGAASQSCDHEAERGQRQHYNEAVAHDANREMEEELPPQQQEEEKDARSPAAILQAVQDRFSPEPEPRKSRGRHAQIKTNHCNHRFVAPSEPRPLSAPVCGCVWGLCVVCVCVCVCVSGRPLLLESTQLLKTTARKPCARFSHSKL